MTQIVCECMFTLHAVNRLWNNTCLLAKVFLAVLVSCVKGAVICGASGDVLTYLMSLNACHVTGVSRRHVKLHKNVKNVNILQFGDLICNHHEKCFKISTHMSSVGLTVL